MNVLKSIVFCTFLLTGSNICSAQEISIRGGFNLSQISFKEGSKVIEGVKLNPGFNLGPVIEFPLNGKLSVETGILFTTKGYKQKGGDVTGDINYTITRNFYYLELPFLMKASFQVGKTELFGMIGPYIAYALFGNEYTTGSGPLFTPQEKTPVKWGNDAYYKLDRLDYGPKFGGGIKLDKIQLGVSYGLGLKNFSNNGILKQKNRVLEIYIAYQIKSLK